MTWEQERDLVLYKLDELKGAHEAQRKEMAEDRKILAEIRDKLTSYQASVKTLKWVSATIGAGLALLADWGIRLLR